MTRKRKPEANDNQPYDEVEWRKAYMREYMRKLRERKRRERRQQPKDKAS